jgi:hypothetical protein
MLLKRVALLPCVLGLMLYGEAAIMQTRTGVSPQQEPSPEFETPHIDKAFIECEPARMSPANLEEP